MNSPIRIRPSISMRALLSALVLSLGSPLLRASEDRPANVLLIVSDDQGYADLGCIGANDIQTPNLDRLARGGIRLTNFYVTWPACTPSRASLLTGRYPQRNGMSDMIRNEAPDYGHKYAPADYLSTLERIGGMDEREVIIPSILRNAGYYSGLFGKWDLGMHRRFLPVARGFDEFYGFANTGVDYYTHERYGVPSMYRGDKPTTEDKGTYATYLFERESLRFLRANWQRPFFLFVPFNAPHQSSSLDPKIRTSVQAPEEYLKLYPLKEPATERVEKFPRYVEGDFTGPVEVTTRAGQVRDFRAAMTCMDASIGRILDFLDEKGIADDTLIIYLSDNGGGMGADNSPLRGGKGQMFEGGIRVNCIVRWPRKLPAGVVNDEFLTALEVLPTILAATGAQAPVGLVLDGFDMLPVLKGEKPSPRTEMFWQQRDNKAARVGHWKWIDSGRGGGLFDLSRDIGEKQDLSAAHPEKVEELKGRFAHWVKEMDAAEPRGPFRDF